MKLIVKNMTFEWTIHQELVITIGKGISMSNYFEGEDLDKITKFIKAKNEAFYRITKREISTIIQPKQNDLYFKNS